tara:strand:- start:514 stop:1356 length:843 start_codon:yes stop_codon:yes gene_type:complete
MKTKTKIFIAKIIFNILIFLGFKKKNLVKRNSIFWKLDISEGIDLSIFLFGSFQNKLVKSISDYILNYKKRGNFFFYIIDIGSNIGDKSLSLAKNLKRKNFKKFQIYSIEASDYAFNKQKENININPELKNRIKLFKFFVSDQKNKPKNIYSSWQLDKNKNTHKIHKGSLKKINEYTKTVSLDDFIKKNKIKRKLILKLDVDGYEMSVLKSSIKTLKKFKPIIFMEYAPYLFKENGLNIKDFLNFVKKNYYSLYDLDFKKLDRVHVNEGSSIDIVLISDR